MTNRISPQHQDRRPGIGSRRVIDIAATTRNPPDRIGSFMPAEGNKKADEGSFASLDKSAEVNEKDNKEGQLRKGGQMSETEEETSE